MADIELVIKIPEGLKKEFEFEQWTALSCMEMKNALMNGTPLPKGHGDLIDRKELTKYPPIWMEDKRRTGEDDAVMLLSDILKAEPVIEADKEEQG